MKRSVMFSRIQASLILFVAGCASVEAGPAEQTLDSSTGVIRIERMLGDLDEPWAVAFLADGAWLVTERDGHLLLVEDGEAREVAGVPAVVAEGQGGLLDVAVARDFEESGEIFLSYSQPADGGARTALARARLDRDGAGLEDVTVIFHMSRASTSGHHFGSRIVEADDGTLFLTVGERGARELAQDQGVHNGKVVRINRDGSIPQDNPFAGGGGLPEIWSYGHRNPQGATLGPDDHLWTVEHGARGGDEINRPEAGLNYGWPVISYGRHYTGGRIGVGTHAEGMEQPLFYWDPSIAPSGMAFCRCERFPGWRDSFLVGSLKFDLISRLERRDGGLVEAERLFEGDYGRIRDVRVAPDGSIWFLSVIDGAAYRVTPADG